MRAVDSPIGVWAILRLDCVIGFGMYHKRDGLYILIIVSDFPNNQLGKQLFKLTYTGYSEVEKFLWKYQTIKYSLRLNSKIFWLLRREIWIKSII